MDCSQNKHTLIGLPLSIAIRRCMKHSLMEPQCLNSAPGL